MDPRKPKLRLENLNELEALSPRQQDAITHFFKGYNLVLDGSAGTGKTFLAVAMALEEVLDKSTIAQKVIIVRSIVPTRNIGFLPGGEEEKKSVYELPYRQICSELFGADNADAYDRLKIAGRIEFASTSFIRGLTIRDAIVIIDEMENLNGHELDSVITRMGTNSRIVLCGDYNQSDLKNTEEKKGILDFMRITDQISSFRTVTFGWKDIVRSDLVREYIMTKEKLNIIM